MFSILKLALAAFALAGAVGAQSQFNLTVDPTTCVASSSYKSCYASAVAAEAGCLSVASTDIEVLACGCLAQLSEMNCYYSACWNRVSSMQSYPRYP
jgi:hypothetical protein